MHTAFTAEVRTGYDADAGILQHLSERELIALLINLKNRLLVRSGGKRDLRTMSVDDIRSTVRATGSGQTADLGVVSFTALSGS